MRHLVGSQAAAQHARRGARAAEQGRVALEQLCLLAEMLADEPQKILDGLLLAAAAAVPVVQEQDHAGRKPRLFGGMAMPASIVIPTRERPRYLAVALASIAPQARAAGAEVIVVDDGMLAANAELAARAGARYVALGEPRGLNAARNAGVDAAHGELVAFVDDDVEVRAGWLDALLAGARANPAADAFTGPIIARFEGRAAMRRTCGREGPPITHMDLGERDQDVRRAWGANMAIRRRAFVAVGPFDPHRRCWGGDEGGVAAAP